MTDLAERVQELAQRLDLDRHVDVAAIVQRGAIAASRPPYPGAGPRYAIPWRWALLPLAALIGVVAVPGTRHTLARWFGLSSTRIVVPPNTGTATTNTGSATTRTPATFPATTPPAGIALSTAEREVGLPAPVPSLLGPPQEVSVTHPPVAGQITLVYAPSSLLPESPIPGVGALVSVFKANVEPGIFQKVAEPGTTVETVQIDGTTGYWLSGAPHSYGYSTPNGEFTIDTLRLATNTLLWEVNGVTYRLEAHIDKATALRIANTIKVS